MQPRVLPDAQLLEALAHTNTGDTSAQHYHVEVLGRLARRSFLVKEEDDGDGGQGEQGGCPTLGR